MAKLFSDAHESEVPSVLLLEKEMNLYNNSIGYHIEINYPNSTVEEVIEIIYQETLDGNLRYVKPLDCANCLNGIIITTVLTPTNQ